MPSSTVNSVQNQCHKHQHNANKVPICVRMREQEDGEHQGEQLAQRGHNGARQRAKIGDRFEDEALEGM